jgi:hypothetical protein
MLDKLHVRCVQYLPHSQPENELGTWDCQTVYQIKGSTYYVQHVSVMKRRNVECLAEQETPRIVFH